MNSEPQAIAGGADALKIKMEIKPLTGKERAAPTENRSPLTLPHDPSKLWALDYKSF